MVLLTNIHWGLLKACLQFITGSAYIPPMGFHNHILDFFEEKRLPFARTCTLQLQLSTACASYDDFEQELKLAVNEFLLCVILFLVMFS